MPRHKAKHTQGQFGIVQRFLALKENPAVNHGELGVRQPRPQTLKLSVKGGARRRKLLEQLQGHAMNQPRVPEIDSHPIRCGQRAAARRADSLGRGFVLGQPGERVVVPAVSEMQKASYGHQELQRRVESLA